MTNKGSLHIGWVIVGTSFVTLALAYGVWYSFSVFFVALLKEFGWSRSIVAGAFSLFLIIHGITGPFAGRMIDRFSPQRVFVVGSLILGGGLALCSLIRSPWQFYLFFGVLAGMGVGSIGWIPNATIIQQWFKEGRGLAMGIISSGVGIGILICLPSIQHLINRVGWRMTYLIMACFIPFVVISVAILFLKRPPRITSLLPLESEISDRAIRDPLVIDKEWASRSWTIRQAISTKQFWLLCLFFFFSTLTAQSILAHHVAFFVDQGLKPLLAAYIVGMVGMMSMGGKILWGALSDRIGREITYTMGMSCSITGMILLISYTISHSPFTPYAYALFFGVGYAVTASLPPLIAADFFAGESYGSILGTLWISNGLGAACGTWLGGFLFDQVKSYVPYFIVMIACALFACFNIWKAAPRKIRLVPGKKGFSPSA
jgi:MFS family permease